LLLRRLLLLLQTATMNDDSPGSCRVVTPWHRTLICRAGRLGTAFGETTSRQIFHQKFIHSLVSCTIAAFAMYYFTEQRKT